MVFITGDTHGSIDVKKLKTKNLTRANNGKKLTKDDYVIVCGDFGFIWGKEETPEEKFWLDHFNKCEWTTLFIDGNHENFARLNAYPVEEWHGGRVQKIRDNVIHICRGSIIDLEGKTYFCFGGAESHDKMFRRKNISWWEEEMPTEAEMQYARENLAKYDNTVDYIITHSFPNSYVREAGFATEEHAFMQFLDEIDRSVWYNGFWYSGHYHIDKFARRNHIFVYNKIHRIAE